MWYEKLKYYDQKLMFDLLKNIRIQVESVDTKFISIKLLWSLLSPLHVLFIYLFFAKKKRLIWAVIQDDHIFIIPVPLSRTHDIKHVYDISVVTVLKL